MIFGLFGNVDIMQYSRLHIFVSGKVQGVYFRQNTSYKAQELNIMGWVRNLKDGRVEAVLEGERENINKLLDWCNDGPKNAIVTDIEIINEPYRKEFSDFQILTTA
jgi:acylphosphatase